MKVTIECTVSEFEELFKTTVTNNVVVNKINNTSNAVCTDTDENYELADYYRTLLSPASIPDWNQIAIDADGCVFVYQADEMITIIDKQEYWWTTDDNEMHISDCEPNKFDWKETHMWIKDL